MYCDLSANFGTIKKFDGKTIHLSIGLQCGPSKMWDKKNHKCISISSNIWYQLLNNHEQNDISGDIKSDKGKHFRK